MTEQPTDLMPPAPGSPADAKATGLAAAEEPLDTTAVVSWSLYDFANSGFAAMVVTFVYATYFTKYMAGPAYSPEQGEIIGTEYWSYGVSATAIIVALCSPFLGAIADRGGYRKLLLGITTIVCIIATAGLAFPVPGQLMLALILFTIANTAFELGSVFYNAFLPDIAPANRIGAISGIGWACGYVGGLIVMGIALYFFVFPKASWPGFPVDTGGHVRVTNLLVAIWFAVFSIPMFLFVKEDRSKASPASKGIIRETTAQLVETWHELKRYKQIIKLLAARLFYNDGLVTIFNFGGIYATGVFKFTTEEVLLFGIVLNITAAIGAFGLGFLDDRIGGKNTIMLTNIAIALLTILTMFANEKWVFWVAGALIGVFVGPNQSSSRSLMGRFVPDDKENEFFGFFAFSGKATAFMGPLLLGILTSIFKTQRAGFAVVVLFMLIGGAILWTVDEDEGRRAAARSGTTSDTPIVH